MTRNYIPDCISLEADQRDALQAYGVARAKFNIFMLILYVIFFCVLVVHYISIALSPAKRKSMDWYTWVGLGLFLLIDTLAMWNSAALIQGEFKNCMENYQIRYLLQSVMLVACSGMLISGWHKACHQVYYYSVHKTLLTAEQIKKRDCFIAVGIVFVILLFAVIIFLD